MNVLRCRVPMCPLVFVLASLAAPGDARAASTASAASDAAGAPVGVKRAAELTWTSAGPDLPAGTQVAVLAGDPAKAEPFTLRIRFPAKTRVMPHVHPASEHVTVIQGRMGIGSGETWDDSKLEWLDRGDMFWVEKGAPHFGSAKTPVIIEIHATGPWGLTYVHAEDAPVPAAGK